VGPRGALSPLSDGTIEHLFRIIGHFRRSILVGDGGEP